MLLMVWNIVPVGSIPINNKQNRKSEKFVTNFEVITFEMFDMKSQNLKNKEKRTLVKCSLK
jgi:hypothetical protein